MHPAIPFMQLTVALTADSPHQVNKIVATVKGADAQGLPYIVSRTNFWPGALEPVARELEIGNSSGWIHAETAALFDSPCTQGAAIFTTDPPCPNCMKNIIEAGIAEVYVDAAGFRKPYAEFAGEQALKMSEDMAARAGISFAKVDLPDLTVTVLNRPEHHIDIEESTEAGPILLPGEERLFPGHVLEVNDRLPGRDFSTCCALTDSGQLVFVTVTPHVVCGYKDEAQQLINGKYSYVLTSLTRLLMQARRLGVRPILDTVTCQRVPTSRELVNFVGAGGRRIRVLETGRARDEASLEALSMLKKLKILDVKSG